MKLHDDMREPDAGKMPGCGMIPERFTCPYDAMREPDAGTMPGRGMIPERFTYPFCYVPHPLIREASRYLTDIIDADTFLKNLFGEGKMMGVMLVQGQKRGDFQPDDPVLHPFGVIHRRCSVSDSPSSDFSRYPETPGPPDSTAGQGRCSNSGFTADSSSLYYIYGFSGNVSGMSRVSGFVPPVFDLMPTEGHYRRKEAEITALNRKIENVTDPREAVELKHLRREMSTSLQEWIFDHYIVSNARGELKSVRDIFMDRGLVPPAGTGDCAAPKMLHYAFLHHLKPLAMGEFWYGASPQGEVRQSGSFYPSCLGKCGPLLEYMMQGLEVEQDPLESDFTKCNPSIIFQDESIVVVDKPSGMLSVQGRKERISLQRWLEATTGREVFSCHRLDMDTSGIMVYAFSKEAKAAIEGQFSRREVSKTYIARLVAGRPFPASGVISLPLMQDYYDRPRQKVDFKQGKAAVTRYSLVRNLPDGGAIVRFFPETGRTHQIRVHCAHPLGLGRPIKGDRLYGDATGERLMLHAETLSFRHPATAELLVFSSDLKDDTEKFGL